MQSEDLVLRDQRRDGANVAQPPSPVQVGRGSHSPEVAGTRTRNDESWVEVSSQPSSSSLSSAAEEIITTGLRVQHDSNSRRSRPHRHARRSLHKPRRSLSAGGGSSQDEYEESESESDRVMTSSNEGLHISPLHQEWRPGAHSSESSEHLDHDEEEDDDDEENVTTVNAVRGEVPQFQPQPNAFNRPPSQQTERQSASRHGLLASSPAASPRPALRSGSQRHSYPAQATQHSPYNVMSPSYQADHDAALRASLSTLLSCAAAARALPKTNSIGGGCGPTPSSRVEPSALRIVPESVVLGTSPARTSGDAATRRPINGPASPRSRSSDKAKRAASDRERQSAKKARRSLGPSSSSLYSVDDISPTLLTWVVSAGVVVLVGALSFSAGYAVGKEAGHAEAAGGLGGCGRELALTRGASGGAGGGLRKLRWTDGLAV